MARAKRTDRADARRRYRATQADVQAADGAEIEDEEVATPAPASRSLFRRAPSAPGPAPARPSASGSASSRPTPPPTVRPSFTGAFRAAARPFDVRSDIAYIPTLALRTRAVWLPGLAAIASGALFLLSQPLGSNGLANLAFQLFVLPPTIAGSFLAGILAPRATYIAGGIAALIGALVFAVAVAVTPTSLSAATITPTASPSASAAASASDSGSAAPSASADASASPVPSASPAPATPAPAATDSDKVSAIIQSIALSVPFGIAIGAFGGYYKRFLYLSNPSRQRRELEQQRQKGQRGQSPKKRY